MHLLGEAGGVGPAMDAVCCGCPTLLAMAGGVATGYFALVLGSWRLLNITVALVGSVGAMVVLPLVTKQPTEDPETLAAIEDQWQLFWWWVLMVVGTTLLAVRLRWEARHPLTPQPPTNA